MNPTPDPYENWIAESEDIVPAVALTPITPSNVSAHSPHRGLKIVAWILGGLVATLVAAIVTLNFISKTRVEAERSKQRETEASTSSDNAATQRAAAEAKVAAVVNEQRGAAISASLGLRDQTELTAAVARSNAARRAAEEAAKKAQAAVNAAGSASVDQLDNLTFAARTAKQAAESALVDIRTQAKVVERMAEDVALRQQESQKTERAAQQSAILQAAANAQEMARRTVADSVNRSLARPDLTLVVLLDSSNKPAWSAMDEMAGRLTAAGRLASARVLTPVFYTTPLAAELADQGPATVLTKLKLEARRIIVGRIEATSRAPDGNGFTTTDFSGVLTVFAADGTSLGSLRWRAAGAARSPRESTAIALTKAWDTMDWTKLIDLLAP